MHAPTDLNWQALKRVLRYLHGSLREGILLHRLIFMHSQMLIGSMIRIIFVVPQVTLFTWALIQLYGVQNDRKL